MGLTAVLNIWVHNNSFRVGPTERLARQAIVNMEKEMKKINILLIVATTFISFNAHAGLWHTAKIKNVYPQADGNFVLILYADHSSCTNANSPDYYYVSVGQNGVTQEGANKMYAAALAAAISGKSVTFNFDENSSTCSINRLSLDL